MTEKLSITVYQQFNIDSNHQHANTSEPVDATGQMLSMTLCSAQPIAFVFCLQIVFFSLQKLSSVKCLKKTE